MYLQDAIQATGHDPTIDHEDLLPIRLAIQHASHIAVLHPYAQRARGQYIALLSPMDRRAIGDGTDPTNPMSLVWSAEHPPVDLMGRRVHWKLVPRFTEEGPMESTVAEDAAAYHANQQIPEANAPMTLPRRLVEVAPLAACPDNFDVDYGQAGPSEHTGGA